VGTLAAWLAALVGAIVLLRAAGSGALATPSPSLGAVRTWLDGRDGVVAAFAVVRLTALGAAWYLLVTTVVELVVAIVRARPLLLVGDRLTPAVVHRVVAVALGAGVGAVALSSTAAADECTPAVPALRSMARLP